jgi:hypothetical protein
MHFGISMKYSIHHPTASWLGQLRIVERRQFILKVGASELQARKTTVLAKSPMNVAVGCTLYRFIETLEEAYWIDTYSSKPTTHMQL